MMKNVILIFILIIISTQLLSQINNNKLTQIDSTETFYSKIQKEILFKELGKSSLIFYNTDSSIFQLIKFENFIPNVNSNNIWTIIDKFQYDKNGLVEKSEHWKTDNKSKMCKCGTWQLSRKGNWTFVNGPPGYPKCNTKEFDCDSFGNKLKK